MSKPDENSTAALVELLLREPQVVAWLEPAPAEEAEDDEPPRAA